MVAFLISLAINLAIQIGLNMLARLLTPGKKRSKPAPFESPTASSGQPLGKGWGIFESQPTVVYVLPIPDKNEPHGDLDVVRYEGKMLLVLGWGPVNVLYEIVSAERSVGTQVPGPLQSYNDHEDVPPDPYTIGPPLNVDPPLPTVPLPYDFDVHLTNGKEFSINVRQMYGGGGEGGGLQGLLMFYPGYTDQPIDPLVAEIDGNLASAFPWCCYARLGAESGRAVGISTEGLNQQGELFYFGTQPSPPPISFILGAYPDALLGDGGRIKLNANPVEIIYEIYTDTKWGMAVPVDRIDVAQWTTTAATIKSEALGISIPRDDPGTADDLIEDILRHIDGGIVEDPITGLLQIKLARPQTPLLTIGAANTENLKRGRPLAPKSLNEIQVRYRLMVGAIKGEALSDISVAQTNFFPTHYTRSVAGDNLIAESVHIFINDVEISPPLVFNEDGVLQDHPLLRAWLEPGVFTFLLYYPGISEPPTNTMGWAEVGDTIRIEYASNPTYTSFVDEVATAQNISNQQARGQYQPESYDYTFYTEPLSAQWKANRMRDTYSRTIETFTWEGFRDQSHLTPWDVVQLYEPLWGMIAPIPLRITRVTGGSRTNPKLTFEGVLDVWSEPTSVGLPPGGPKLPPIQGKQPAPAMAIGCGMGGVGVARIDLFPTSTAYSVEVWEADDAAGAGAALITTIVAGTVPMYYDGTVGKYYAARQISGSTTPGPMTAWITCTGEEPPTDPECVLPTYSYVADDFAGTLTLTVTDPQNRVQTVSWRSRSGNGPWSAWTQLRGPGTPTPPPEEEEPVTGDYFVSLSGSDGNPGSEASPFLTIQHAVDVAAPGDTIVVENGTYTATSSGETMVEITTTGTALLPCVLRARNPGSVILDGNNLAVDAIRFNTGAAYWTVDGFVIRNIVPVGAGDCDGVTIYGSGLHHLTVRRCDLHHIGDVCSDTSNGLNGIFVGASSGVTTDVVIERCRFWDIGRRAPGESGCSPGNTNWQNHDHGIYVAEADNVTIRNCQFWDIRRGWCIQRYNTGGHNTQNLHILNNSFAFENPDRDGNIIIATDTTGCRIENNLFYDPQTAGVRISDGTHTSGVIRKNITFGGTVTTGSTTGFTLSGNIDNTNPMITSTAEPPNFHLQAGSPAIDVGVNLAEVTEDYDGFARPHNTFHDIGAFEFGSTTAAAVVAAAVDPGPYILSVTLSAIETSRIEWEITYLACDGSTGTLTGGYDFVPAMPPPVEPPPEPIPVFTQELEVVLYAGAGAAAGADEIELPGEDERIPLTPWKSAEVRTPITWATSCYIAASIQRADVPENAYLVIRGRVPNQEGAAWESLGIVDTPRVPLDEASLLLMDDEAGQLGALPACVAGAWVSIRPEFLGAPLHIAADIVGVNGGVLEEIIITRLSVWFRALPTEGPEPETPEITDPPAPDPGSCTVPTPLPMNVGTEEDEGGVATTWVRGSTSATLTIDGAASGYSRIRQTVSGLTPNEKYTFYLTANPNGRPGVRPFLNTVGEESEEAGLPGAEELEVVGYADGSGQQELLWGVHDVGGSGGGGTVVLGDYDSVAEVESDGWVWTPNGFVTLGISTTVKETGDASIRMQLDHPAWTGGEAYFSKTLPGPYPPGAAVTMSVRFRMDLKPWYANPIFVAGVTSTGLEYVGDLYEEFQDFACVGGEVDVDGTIPLQWGIKTGAGVSEHFDYYWDGPITISVAGVGSFEIDFSDLSYCAGSGISDPDPGPDPSDPPPVGPFPPPPQPLTRWFQIWNGDIEGTGVWNATTVRFTTKNAVNVLNTCEDHDTYIFFVPGNTDDWLNNGVFHEPYYRAMIDSLYNDTATRNAIEQASTGTGAFSKVRCVVQLIDEPYHPTRYGGPIPFVAIERCAIYCKSKFPNLETMLRVDPTIFWYTRKMVGVDSLWGEYLLARGPIDSWIASRQAAVDNFEQFLYVGLHYAAFDRAGTPRNITPAEMRYYGRDKLAKLPWVRGFGGWKWVSSLWAQSGFPAAAVETRDEFSLSQP